MDVFNYDGPLIACFGNPLLDLSATINDNDLINKYNLDIDGQVEMSASAIEQLYKDVVKKYNIECTAGGCAQNTARIMQWLIDKPKMVVFLGGIGNDYRGKLLTQVVEKSGVLPRYTVHSNLATGTCIALVNGANRSLIAHLGAAEEFPTESITNNWETEKNVKSCYIVYIEAFFLRKRLPVVNYLTEFCHGNEKTLVFNLSAVYYCEEDPENVFRLASQCDILIGNAREFESIGKYANKNIKKLAEEVAIDFNKSYKERSNHLMSKYGKIVIVTNGSESVFCTFGNQQQCRISVPKLPVDKIKDTTGAGDSFVAGFLFALLAGKEIPSCLECGSFVAREIIQQVGCTVPSHKFNFL